MKKGILTVVIIAALLALMAVGSMHIIDTLEDTPAEVTVEAS